MDDFDKLPEHFALQCGDVDKYLTVDDSVRADVRESHARKAVKVVPEAAAYMALEQGRRHGEGAQTL